MLRSRGIDGENEPTVAAFRRVEKRKGRMKIKALLGLTLLAAAPVVAQTAAMT